MRKYLIGGIVGFTLALGVSAHAEEVLSLVGKQVQGEVNVKLNGQTLDSKGAIIDGSSLLPVRTLAESLGLNVDFKNGEVLLNSSTTKEASTTVTDTTTQSVDSSSATTQTTTAQTTTTQKKKIVLKSPIMDGEIDLEKADEVKSVMQGKIAVLEYQLKNMVQKDDTKTIQAIQKGIQDYKDAIAEIDRQKAELSK